MSLDVQTEKIVGRYMACADVRFERRKNILRVNLWHPIVYEIPRIAPDAGNPEAVVVEQLDRDPTSTTAYLGWRGQLWRPAWYYAERQVAGRSVRMKTEHLSVALNCKDRIDFGLPWHHAGEHLIAMADPFKKAGGQERRLSHNELNVNAEDVGKGEVYWTNRAALQAEYEKAIANLLIVGDDVYQRAEEPTWRPTWSNSNAGPKLRITTDPGHHYRDFRLDRSDQALAWSAAQSSERAEFVGKLLVCDGDYLKRDDVAHGFAEVAIGFSSGKDSSTTMRTNRMPAALMCAVWATAVACGTPDPFAGVQNPAQAYAAAQELLRQANHPLVPPEMRKEAMQFVEGAVRRTDFEIANGYRFPDDQFNEEDVAALQSLVPSP